MKTPRERAEACFSLARSTLYAGERANAIAAGTRIAETAGLSLDLFDIPGRKRGAAPPRSSDLFGYRAHTVILDDVDIRTALDELAKSLRSSPSFRAANRCPGCGVVILFGDSCTNCYRAGRA